MNEGDSLFLSQAKYMASKKIFMDLYVEVLSCHQENLRIFETDEMIAFIGKIICWEKYMRLSLISIGLSTS